MPELLTPKDVSSKEAEEHVIAIVFNSVEDTRDDDCIICIKAQELGLWDRWDLSDP